MLKCAVQINSNCFRQEERREEGKQEDRNWRRQGGHGGRLGKQSNSEVFQESSVTLPFIHHSRKRAVVWAFDRHYAHLVLSSPMHANTQYALHHHTTTPLFNQLI